MGTASSALAMATLIVLLLAVAVSCEPDDYTLGQVAAGATAGGVITGVDYGHGLVSGVGALGVGRVAAVPAVTYAAVPHAVYYGKREADPEPYTVGQIAHGAHIASALA